MSESDDDSVFSKGITVASTTKTLTVRLPMDLYQRSSDVAQRRRISLNALVQESLSALMKAEQDSRLYQEFGLLGEDLEETDVEFAIPAQWEVVRRGES